MTAVSVVKPSRRGNVSRKRPLWLPIIAPKDEAIPSTPGPSLSVGPIKNPIPRSRLRFPPRSRTGCWTCRSRKVKCDESHPQCNQCTRLGHACDYKPRLCFRDDTRRVMERMSYVKIAGNVVWDPNAIALTALASDALPHDLLPSFAVLASDEERERKAQASIPGTYHVIVIPESFAHLPEYTTTPCDKDLDSISSPISADGESDHLDSPIEVDDPNVVIVKIVRDTRRYPYSHRRDSTQTPDSDLPLPLPVDSALYPAIQSIVDEDPAHDKFDLRNYEIGLFDHFRHVVWQQLMAGGTIFARSNHHHLDVDLFEQEAANFPPLYHAILAVSALSRFRQGDDQSVHSLHYVNQAYDYLQNNFDSANDVVSDRIFLTYFLLVIYETIAPRTTASSVWSHHVSRLLQIYIARQTTLGGERYPFIIWWICNIDLHALLSGIGTGEFVRTVIDHNIYPGLDFLLYRMEDGRYPAEPDNLSMTLRLYHNTFTLLVRLGLFAASAREYRQSYPDSPLDHQLNAAEELREELRRLWGSSEMCYLVENRESLPELAQYILQQITILFHTALLFSYTSLWPRQRLEQGQATEDEIHHHATMILQLAETLIPSDSECGRNLIGFPMFLAGAVAASSGLKIRAWQLLSRLEEEEMGYNASTTNYLLQLVYERQMQHSRHGGEAIWIDWMELVAARECPVHYG